MRSYTVQRLIFTCQVLQGAPQNLSNSSEITSNPQEGCHTFSGASTTWQAAPTRGSEG